jgi:hypothetical protein
MCYYFQYMLLFVHNFMLYIHANIITACKYYHCMLYNIHVNIITDIRDEYFFIETICRLPEDFRLHKNKHTIQLVETTRQVSQHWIITRLSMIRISRYQTSGASRKWECS